MKTFAYLFAVLVIAVIFGLSLPSIVPACHCGLDSGCQGCGGAIGNALGSFSLMCFALGGIGFVLLLWFGIPLAVLGGIVFGIYSLFSKGEKSVQNQTGD
jgi:hypothetical protein